MGDSANAVRTIGIFHWDNFLVVIKIVEKRGEDPPASVELVITDEIRVVALQSVQDQRLVGLRDLEIGEPPSVCEIKFGDDRLHAETGQLGVHLDVDALVGLYTNDKLVAWNVLEDTRGHILELDANLRLLLVESFSCLEDEGHSIPPFIFDVSNHRGKCRASRVFGHCVILLVGRLRAIQRFAVLADDDVLRLDSRHTAENTNLLIANVLGGEGDRSLHGKERQNLQQIFIRSQLDILIGGKAD